MEAKHTLGPWEIRTYDNGPYFTEVEIWHQNYGRLAIMPNNSSIWNSEKKEAEAVEAFNQTIANAKLMAAAPEMLEALKGLHKAAWDKGCSALFSEELKGAMMVIKKTTE